MSTVGHTERLVIENGIAYAKRRCGALESATHEECVAEILKLREALEDAADMLHEWSDECSHCNYGDGPTRRGSEGEVCEECSPICEAERRARELLPDETITTGKQE